MNKLKKITLYFTLAVCVVIAMLPIYFYYHTLGLVTKMPEPPKVVLSQKITNEQWHINEHCSQNQCSSITPYWIYRWVIGAIYNDFITSVETNKVYDNVSKMASQIAISHMRQGNFKGKGMMWWHLTHINLSIWVQRNWTSNQIVTKFKEIKA